VNGQADREVVSADAQMRQVPFGIAEARVRRDRVRVGTTHPSGHFGFSPPAFGRQRVLFGSYSAFWNTMAANMPEGRPHRNTMTAGHRPELPIFVQRPCYPLTLQLYPRCGCIGADPLHMSVL